MPYKEKKIVKIYWTIGEIANMLGITEARVRSISDRFNIAKRRNRKGVRHFRKVHLDAISLVVAMTSLGFSRMDISDAVQYFFK